MKAEIRVLSNREEIELAEKIGTRKTPEVETTTTFLYFHARDLGDFYIDPLDDKRDIMLFLYPNRCFRAVYNEELLRELELVFSRDVVMITTGQKIG